MGWAWIWAWLCLPCVLPPPPLGSRPRPAAHLARRPTGSTRREAGGGSMEIVACLTRKDCSRRSLAWCASRLSLRRGHNFQCGKTVTLSVSLLFLGLFALYHLLLLLLYLSSPSPSCSSPPYTFVSFLFPLYINENEKNRWGLLC